MTTPRDDIAGLSERLRRMSPQLDILQCEDVLQAADRLDQLDALLKERDALSRCGRENCLGHKADGCASWVREERLDEVKAERDAAIANWSEWKRLANECLAKATRLQQERDEWRTQAKYETDPPATGVLRHEADSPRPFFLHRLPRDRL